MPAPRIFRHIAKRRPDATLSRNRMTSCGKDLGQASRIEATVRHAKRRTETRPTCTYDKNIVIVINYFVGWGFSRHG
jgi:hypothetical protein